MQLYDVPVGIGQERLEASTYLNGIGHREPLRSQRGHLDVEPVDEKGEMLTQGGRDVGLLDEVDLSVTDVQPGTRDPEVVGAVGPLGQAEHVDIEAQGSIDIAHVDRDVMEREHLRAGRRSLVDAF